MARFLSLVIALAALPGLAAAASPQGATATPKTTLAYPYVANPGSVDFGARVAPSTSPAKTITFTGQSYDITTLTYNNVTAPAGFVVDSSSCVVISSTSCTVNVRFAPSTVGVYSGNVTFTYLFGLNGLSTAVPVSGVGQPSVVPQYYQSILQRAPDPGGEAFWNAEASRMEGLGASLVEAWYAMAMSFFSSAEYAAFGRDDVGFVTDLYQTFLGRAPDAGGLAFWTSQIAQGMPRGVALVSFMFSTEFENSMQAIYGTPTAPTDVNVTGDFYRGLLSRLPDDVGFRFWLAQFENARCSRDATAINNAVEFISSTFANSPEYLNRNRTNSEYVGDLYNAFMRRGGDLAGVQFWISQLDTGAMTRDEMRRRFAASPEFATRVSAMLTEPCGAP
jgi:hypothetical protein